MFPKAHLLGVAQEIRLNIYRHVTQDIQNYRCPWQANPSSPYDGLRTTCKTLYAETRNHVFQNTFPYSQIQGCISIPLRHKDTYIKIRALNIEIDLGADTCTTKAVETLLRDLQVSLQELHLFFVGQDEHGNVVKIHGCGSRSESTLDEPIPLLTESGQYVEKNMDLLRPILVMRKLRILQIENANIPILQAALLVQKPELEFVSITTDPRTVIHAFQHLDKRRKREVMKGFLLAVDREQPPPIKVLQLSANSAVPAEKIVNRLANSLRHLSWIVPNQDFQPPIARTDNDFDYMTGRLIETLCRGAPQLETLRLCIRVHENDNASNANHWDENQISTPLGLYLPHFPALKNLELHYSTSRLFFRQRLLDYLPDQLERLYISDCTMSADELVEQVRRSYYLAAAEGIGMEKWSDSVTSSDTAVHCFGSARQLVRLHDPAERIQVSFNSQGYAKYTPTGHNAKTTSTVIPRCAIQREMVKDHDYLDELGDELGEKQGRYDFIPFVTGNLGFVIFEYEDPSLDDSHAVAFPRANTESDRAKLMKLNGQLLDREHNRHLASIRDLSRGIRPKLLEQDEQVHVPVADKDETASYSNHAQIYAAIYKTREFAPKPQLVERNRKALEDCLGPDQDTWYFGNESEAMEVFEQEQVVKIEDQRQKPMPIDVEAPLSRRCQWMSPDYPVPAVGSFPAPPIPENWKEATPVPK